MLRLLVRFLGSGAGVSSPARGAGVRRFTPGLEVLDGRTLPSAVLVGGEVDTDAAVLRSAEWSPPASPDGGARGGIVQGGAAGGVTADGGASGGVLGLGARGGVVDERDGGGTHDQSGANESHGPLVKRTPTEEIPQ
jgi:hypothetical protein